MPRKAVLIVNLTLTFVVALLFWSAIRLFRWQGLKVYFLQVGLYLFLLLLARWGLQVEKVKVPISARRILEALLVTLVSWLGFVLVMELWGVVELREEFLALTGTPILKVGANILSTWLLVGLGEELLFRGYFLRAFLRHCTGGTVLRRMIVAVFLVSALFSLWHLPSRMTWLWSGEINLVWFLLSLWVLFLLGLGYAYLFIRSENLLLVGLVHGISDLPLVGENTPWTFFLLVVAIGGVEILRLLRRWKAKAWQTPQNGQSQARKGR